MGKIGETNQPRDWLPELIFERHRDGLSWGYSCPFLAGETPDGAFRRVLEHVITTLPDFGRPKTFTSSSVAGPSSTVREMPKATYAWQQAIHDSLPESLRLEASLSVVPALQTAHGPVDYYLEAAAIDIKHHGLFDPTSSDANTIDIVVVIYLDVYDPPPPDASPERILQAEHNRPRLTRFLSSILNDLNATFTYRDAFEVGPTGVLEADAPQDGLPAP